MPLWLDIVILATHILFASMLFIYLYLNLQWYNYKITRVLLKHHKIHWHFIYFLFPVLIYKLAYTYFELYFYIVYLPSFLVWYIRLDKKLVFTGRIWRAFGIYAILVVGGDIFGYISKLEPYPLFSPLIATLVITFFLEKVLLRKYTDMAVEKLASMKNLRIIAITASYGKTSIKNFIAHLLEGSFRVYATPRSVNTITGIIKDINTSLPIDSEFYIVEAGARQKGDIKEISDLICHQYAIIGRVGGAHIEYFKTLKNIRDTKLELLSSKRLIKAYIYKDLEVPKDVYEERFPGDIIEKRADLDGLEFLVKFQDSYVEFKSSILGRFNIENLYIAIKVAFDMGIDIETIKRRVAELKPIPHRLQKIEAGGKIIIDDSFNGNLEGMLEGCRLASLHTGRKVIVTPGLIESDKESNRKLAEVIDKSFDLAIITGDLNSTILSQNISKPVKVILKEKSDLQEVLKAYTSKGDLILFANDAPNFI